METSFKLAKASLIDIKRDCFWELYFPTGEKDPSLIKNLMIGDIYLYMRFNDMRFQDILEDFLNNNHPFDFDYYPKNEDIIFLKFAFEGTNLQYSFTFSREKNKWLVPMGMGTNSRYFCIEKSISGIILNPMALLLEWA